MSPRGPLVRDDSSLPARLSKGFGKPLTSFPGVPPRRDVATSVQSRGVGQEALSSLGQTRSEKTPTNTPTVSERRPSLSPDGPTPVLSPVTTSGIPQRKVVQFLSRQLKWSDTGIWRT